MALVRRVTLLALAISAHASAQPIDPYKQPAPAPLPAPAPVPSAVPAPAPVPLPAVGPQDPYAPPAGRDPVLSEQVAEQLVGRAQELFDARIYLDAKQLAVEALVESPKGNAADHARYIIKMVNTQLGIRDPDPTPREVKVDVAPIQDPTNKLDKPAEPPARDEIHDGSLAASVHGAVYAGLLGATVGSFFDSNHPAGGAIPVGIAAGLAAGVYLPRLFRSWHWDEAQVRTVGAGSVWGGMIGGMFADTVTGANGGHATGPGILVGASIGASLGVIGGAVLAKNRTFTRGDVALVDTFAGIGTVGGLSMGLLMQPAQAEAYALNAVLGTAGGLVVGYMAAPQSNTTPRRMLRVAGLSAAMGGVPLLIAAGGSTGAQRAAGLLSCAGLIGGAWLGFYLTRNMDVGLDVPDGVKAKPAEDAPPALVGRSSDGTWALNGIGVQPLSPALSPQHGMAMTLVGGTF